MSTGRENAEENDIDERFELQVHYKKRLSMSPATKVLKNIFVLTSLFLVWTKVCLQLIISFLVNPSRKKICGFIQNLCSLLKASKSVNQNEQCKRFHEKMDDAKLEKVPREI